MDDTLRMINELIRNTLPFVGRTGVEVVESGPRSVKARMPLKGNENHVGSMYIGALCTMAEVPGGVLIMNCFDLARYVPIVKSISLDFVRPAKSDVTLRATISEGELDRIYAALEENGKADFTLEGEIKDDSGRIVARSNVLFNIRTVVQRSSGK